MSTPGLERAISVAAALSFDSIMVTDDENRIVYVNDAFEDLTGYKREQVIGENPKLLQGPATDEQVISQLVDAMNAGKSFEGRAINYKADGTPFVMHWKVAPVLEEGKDRATHFVAVQRVLSQ